MRKRAKAKTHCELFIKDKKKQYGANLDHIKNKKAKDLEALCQFRCFT